MVKQFVRKKFKRRGDEVCESGGNYDIILYKPAITGDILNWVAPLIAEPAAC